MAGLGLNVGGFGSVGSSVPAAASAAGSVPVGQQAFGVYSSQTSGRTTAGYGALVLGAAGAVALAYIWWTLPR